VPDDRHRIARFADEVRTDLAFADRMVRYCRPLALRLCREIEAAAHDARFVPAVADAGRERLVLEGGRGDMSAVVELSTPLESAGVAGITVNVATEREIEGSFHARLAYLQTSRQFEGAVSIEPADVLGESFYSLWREVCRRHDAADFDRFRMAFSSAGRPGVAGLVFAGTDGASLQADEYTFLFVRAAGRALMAAASPLLARTP
jgi:hypothetical protein